MQNEHVWQGYSPNQKWLKDKNYALAKIPIFLQNGDDLDLEGPNHILFPTVHYVGVHIKINV